MPVFTFNCVCGESYKDLTKPDVKVKCPKCGIENSAITPTGSSTMVMETKDSYRGKQIRKNQDRMMKDRMRQHHDRNDIAEVVDRYGIKHAERHGLLKRAKKL